MTWFQPLCQGEPSRHPWTVETFRMHGWDDDGHGAAYQASRGHGTDHTEQLPLF